MHLNSSAGPLFLGGHHLYISENDRPAVRMSVMNQNVRQSVLNQNMFSISCAALCNCVVICFNIDVIFGTDIDIVALHVLSLYEYIIVLY